MSPARQGDGARTIFVGGKGGVGKTTVSSALAVHLASTNFDSNILVISTDPAHSLGDALDVDLKSSRGEPVVLTDPVTGGRLAACEVDAAAALADFRENVAAFDVDRLAGALGVSPSLLDSLGLGEFSSLLNNPPPGLDELVALSKVLDRDGTSEYDVIIVDTAPTGHTLRLYVLFVSLVTLDMYPEFFGLSLCCCRYSLRTFTHTSSFVFSLPLFVELSYLGFVSFNLQ